MAILCRDKCLFLHGTLEKMGAELIAAKTITIVEPDFIVDFLKDLFNFSIVLMQTNATVRYPFTK